MPRVVVEVVESAWSKSSYSGANETECVEMAFAVGHTAVRDSKRPDGRRVQVHSGAWSDFVGAVRSGQLR
ncbi:MULTISPECIES: DUF397 domain-containing protein [unclassified Streptomyces]|uniref:DUF397 domain-containing protein n=1 Tax=unclassified Streptomyces TaxID=2593676 RepID=UPI003813256F